MAVLCAVVAACCGPSPPQALQYHRRRHLLAPRLDSLPVTWVLLAVLVSGRSGAAALRRHLLLRKCLRQALVTLPLSLSPLRRSCSGAPAASRRLLLPLPHTGMSAVYATMVALSSSATVTAARVRSTGTASVCRGPPLAFGVARPASRGLLAPLAAQPQPLPLLPLPSPLPRPVLSPLLLSGGLPLQPLKPTPSWRA